MNPRNSMWEKMIDRTADAPVKSRDPRKQASLKMFIENSQTGRILQPAMQGPSRSNSSITGAGKKKESKAYESNLNMDGSVKVEEK